MDELLCELGEEDYDCSDCEKFGECDIEDKDLDLDLEETEEI